MNRREFIRDGAMALMAMGLPSAFALESGDEEIEKTLAAKILAWVEKVNPIDPKTGRRRFISLAYVSDTHKCKRVPGDDDPVNPVKDFWYWGSTLCDPEPTIRLIGAVAKAAQFDAAIHAGDFSTGKTPKAFSPGDYLGVIREVKGLFDKHLPETPFFAIDGNHDRDYWEAKKKQGNRMNDAEWAAALKFLNTDVSKNPDIALTPGIGNSYALDFKRLVKSGGKNLRLVMVSLYDKGCEKDPGLRLKQGLAFADPAIRPDNTVFGVTAHDGHKAFAPVAAEFLKANAGAGFFGSISGHMHFAYTNKLGCGLKADKVGVTNAYCHLGRKTIEAYRFSLFVFDTEANKVREFRLGGGDKKGKRPNRPQELDHEIDIG